ncbi:MAG: hypothetical protein JSS65_07865 [Armatimonadetes bacterium]|nr:hypothetical protein [Armatimonadota bacterium]
MPAILTLAGCQTGTLPDPNDPIDVGVLSPETVRRNLYWANTMLIEREAEGEITPAQSRDFIARRAKELLGSLDITKVNHDDAWQYAEIFMTAKEWKGAKIFLEDALKAPKNDDRRVNDSLRLAQVDARLGDYANALKLARSTFNVRDEDGAPVLPAVYLEIAPVVAGHGFDAELAQLIVDAVAVHKRVKVDTNSDPGKAFVIARRHHILTALKLALTLAQTANRPDLAQSIEQEIARNLPNRVSA